MSGTPFSGVFQTKDGKLFDMMSGNIVIENKSGMSPFSGTFIGADGEEYDLMDFFASLGGGGGGGPVTWAMVVGKPPTFPPATHGHTISDVTGLVAALATAADNAIPLTQKGAPGGVPILDAEGKVPTTQLPPIGGTLNPADLISTNTGNLLTQGTDELLLVVASPLMWGINTRPTTGSRINWRMY